MLVITVSLNLNKYTYNVPRHTCVGVVGVTRVGEHVVGVVAVAGVVGVVAVQLY